MYNNIRKFSHYYFVLFHTVAILFVNYLYYSNSSLSIIFVALIFTILVHSACSGRE